MSKQASALAIGAFVVGAFAILLALLFSMSGDLFNPNTQRGLVVFDGSVKGLKVGAPVAFKGVEIGQVTHVDVFVDTSDYSVVTPVFLRIDRNKIKSSDDKQRIGDTQTMIDKGLRAKLQMQSLLTGLLYVEFDLYPGTEPRYSQKALAKYDIDEDIIVIPTLPQGLQKFARGLEELDVAKLSKNLSDILVGIDKLVNSEEMQALPKNISETLAAIRRLSEGLDKEVAALSPGLNQLVTDAGGSMKTLNRDLPDLSKDAKQALADLSAALENLDHVLSDDSAVLYDIRKAANELGAAGRALQDLAETIDTQPESIIKGKSK